MVRKAYRKVKSNRGRAGIDQVSLEEYQQDLSNNLYKLWNRMASGSYFPPSVRAVSIPKSNGKRRKLGIPTVGDRIAQQVMKDYLEPRFEEIFHENSHGYRPLKSAHQAVEKVRQNVRQYAWVIDMDIKSFFDEVDHKLMIKALEKHVSERWVLMYLKRWLEAPSEDAKGNQIERKGKGTPQGGEISPLLANLYLHYTFDKWMEIKNPGVPFVRYADDVIVHCHSEQEAQRILTAIRERLQQCGLRLNEAKTKIVYCQDYRREKKDYKKKFDFLGFSFQPRSTASQKGGMFLGYDCGISITSKKRISTKWKEMKFHRWTGATIQEIARLINPIMRGIFQYYGRYKRWELQSVIRNFHFRLVKWIVNKYKRFRGRYKRAYEWLIEVRKGFPNLFYHWTLGYKTM
ncbi:group II intron reverse transcriptase/maturase [Mangrovivirga cuniculi]|uniref:RNA-directed DNA polymerase n=2 Tax=Mangrovivirga cuniculi TaxID=2715131 RepID=A0A4D7KBX7_9BACT|nr:group II intron reverse transcriptase/maturase [Mangrovivirga cuniculi]